MVSAPPLILNIKYARLINVVPAGNVARLVSIATDLIEELIAMERMRVGADETSISDPDPEFDPEDPEFMRFAYTGGFTLSVYGASTGSKGYSVEEEGNVSGLTDRGYGRPCLAHPATGAAAKPWKVLSSDTRRALGPTITIADCGSSMELSSQV